RQGRELLRQCPWAAPGGSGPCLRGLRRAEVRGRGVASVAGQRLAGDRGLLGMGRLCRGAGARRRRSRADHGTCTRPRVRGGIAAAVLPQRIRCAGPARARRGKGVAGATDQAVRGDRRRRHRRARCPRRRTGTVRGDLPAELVPAGSRDDPGQPVREAGRCDRGPALPPAPGRLLVRPPGDRPRGPPRSAPRITDRWRHALPRPRRRPRPRPVHPARGRPWVRLADRPHPVVPGGRLLQPERRAGRGLGRPGHRCGLGPRRSGAFGPRPFEPVAVGDPGRRAASGGPPYLTGHLRARAGGPLSPWRTPSVPRPVCQTAQMAPSTARTPAPTPDRLGSPGTGVLVTGGGSGIGRATALALAEVGRPVAVWDIDAEGAEETATICRRDHGVVAEWAVVDVADTAAIEKAVPEAADALGSLGGFVHAAARSGPMPVDFVDDELWDAILNVNLRGAVMISRMLLEPFR